MEQLESWRKVFRDGFAPSLSTKGLQALLKALETDSQELIQGATTEPPPLQVCRDWPIKATCPITYTGWKSEYLTSVEQAETYFAKHCKMADDTIGEAGGCRHLLCWIDDTPRSEMRKELAEEIRYILAGREAAWELQQEEDGMNCPVAHEITTEEF